MILYNRYRQQSRKNLDSEWELNLSKIKRSVCISSAGWRTDSTQQAIPKVSTAPELLAADTHGSWGASRSATRQTRRSLKDMQRFTLRGSSVGIATRYVLDGPGIESRWRARFSAPVQTAVRPTQPPVQRVPGLSRG